MSHFLRNYFHVWISFFSFTNITLHYLKIYSLVGNIKNDFVKYFMQHIRNGLIVDLINS